MTVSISPTKAGTSSAYTVAFTATSGLASGVDTVTLDASGGQAGTVFPSTAASYTITDLTDVNGSGTVTATPSRANANSKVTLTVPATISGGDALSVVATGVTNPPSPSTSQTLSVSTSTDTTAVASGTYSLTASTDGSGTLTSSAPSFPAGSSTTLTFTYTAATGGTSGGAITVAVPSGWTAPTTSSGTAGYVTASKGTVAVAGQSISVSGVDLASAEAMTIVYGSGGGANSAVAPATVSSYSFVATEQSTSTGTATALAASPSVSTTYAADGSGTLAASPSSISPATPTAVDFTYTAAPGGMSAGSVTVTVPGWWTAPTTTSGTPGYTTSSGGSLSLSGRTITISGLTLAGADTVVVHYGAGGGTNGASTIVVGTASFTASSKTTSGGTLSALSAPATLAVAQPTLAMSPASVSTVAGSGGSSNTNGTGTGASFSGPSGVAVANGYAYVGSGTQIRKVNLASGVVTTLTGVLNPGQGAACYDSADPDQVQLIQVRDVVTDGYYVYGVTDCGSYTPRVFKTAISSGATTTLTGVANVNHITFGPDGYLYVGQTTSATNTTALRRIDPVTGASTTIDSLGVVSGAVPVGGAVASDGTYVWWQVSVGNLSRLDRITASTGAVSTMVSSGLDNNGVLASAGDYLYASSGNAIRRMTKADLTGGVLPASTKRIAGAAAGHADGTGTDAWFTQPSGMVSDGTNLWITDSGAHRLRQAVPGTALTSGVPAGASTTLAINPAAVSTFAGSGGSSNTDGTGTAASFSGPNGVAVAGGYAYVGSGTQIRKVNLSSGAVTTLAGKLNPGSGAICADATDPTLSQFIGITDVATDGYYVYAATSCGAYSNPRVTRTSIATGATSGVTTIIGVNHVTFGPDGFLYAASTNTTLGTATLTKIDPATGLAGSVVESLAVVNGYSPASGGLTSDGTYVWWQVAVGNQNRLDRITASTGAVSTMVSNGMDIGGGLASAGDYLYASSGNAIRRLTKADLTVGGALPASTKRIAGAATGHADGTGTDAWFTQPSGLFSDGTNIWITDSGAHRLRQAVPGTALTSGVAAGASTTLAMNPAAVSTFAGSGGSSNVDGTGTAASFSGPNGVAVANGYAYVGSGTQIRKVNLSSGAVTTLAGKLSPGSGANCADATDPTQAQFITVNDVATDGYYVYSANYCGSSNTNRVMRTSIATGATSGVMTIIGVNHVTFGPDGFLYAASTNTTFGTATLTKIDPATGIASSVVESLAVVNGYSPASGSLTSDGTYVWWQAAVGNQNRLDRITANTGSVSTMVTNGMDIGGALASAGDYLYASSGNAIRRLTKADLTVGGALPASTKRIAGAASGHADGTGTDAWFIQPSGLVADGTNIWIADSGTHRLRLAVAGTALTAGVPSGAASTLAINPAAVSTFAGAGGSSNVDGTGTAASFASPNGVAVANGYAYIGSGTQIRKVNLSSGAVTTLAGKLNPGSGANCADATDPTQSQFIGINDVATDGYYVYTATGCGTASNPRVTRTSIATGATSGVMTIVGVNHVTFGPDGFLYAASTNTTFGTATLTKIDPATGIATSVVESLAVVNGYSPASGSLTSDGTYVWWQAAVGGQNRLDRITASTGSVSTVISSNMYSGALTSSGDYLYASNGTSIKRYAKSDFSSAVIAGGSSGYRDGVGTAAFFSSVTGIVADGPRLWIADNGNHRLRVAIAGPVGSPISVVESAGGGNNPSEVGCGCHGGAGDPVSTATGDFWHTFTDIAIPGRGVALDVTRTYNSDVALSSVDGLFGYGWSSSYGMSLTIGSSTVTVAQEDGSHVDFSGGGNSWAPPNPRTLASLTHNGDGTWTLVRRAKETFDFDSSGRLTAQRDLNGNVTAITYPSSSSMVVTDPAGRTLALTLSSGHVTGLADSSSPARTAAYSYDGSGNLTEVVDLGGGHTQFTYDSSHRLLTMRSPRYYGDTTTSPSPVTTNHYDSSGRVDTQTDPLGRTTSFDYTSIAGSTKVTDPKGNVTVEQYTQGLLTAATHAYGTALAATWTYGYDPVTAARTQVTDPLGRVTTFYFDAAGNRTATVDALGRVSSTTYDGSGNPLTLTDPKGTVTTLTYDSHGNAATRSMPLLAANGSTLATSTTTLHHDDSSHPGDLTSVTGPDSQTWTFSYDSYGDRTSVVAPPTPENSAGNEATYNFDSSTGALLSSVSPRGNLSGATAADFTTIVERDAYGRVTVTKDPLWSSSSPNEHRTVRHYDADGNVDYAIDANNKRTDFAYDAAGEQTTITRADATTTSTDYWADGSLKTQYDGANKATAYAYDALGRLSTVTDPLNRVTTYGYDLAGNRTTKQDQGGSCATNPGTGCTRYGYDAANQLTSTTYSDGTTPNVSAIGYDANGNRTSMTDGTGTSSWTWDSLGRLTASTNGASAAVGYGYDIAGHMTSLTYPGSTGTVNRTYDAAGRLRTVVDFASRTNTFSYDADSNLTTAAYGNGTTGTRTYDNAGGLLTMADANGGTTLVDLTYTRDGAGQVASASGNGLGQTSETYGYNSLEQLTSVNSATTAFDAADNLTTLRGATQSFDVANELTSSTAGSGVTYAYDTRGNRTSMTPSGSSATTYGWDQANRLKSFGSSATYAYNGDGLRTSKTVSGSTTAYSWDVAEGLPVVLKEGSTSYVYGPGGLPLEQVTPSATSWFFQDQLGSTRALTDTSAAVVATSTYDAFGSLAASSGSVTSPFGYSGEYTDAESGLIYLRARYYDPASGQFLSRDPLATATRSPYGYVNGNPLNSVDPSGLFCFGGLCSQDFRMSDAMHGFVNFNDGLNDFLVSTVTLGRYHVHATYCGAGLGASYLVGQWTGQIEAALTEGPGAAAEETTAVATTTVEDAATSCANSFTADTPVLMADGKEEPIADVRVGDKVLATDPATGRTEARPVAALIRHSGRHKLVDLTFDDGSKITTTDHHPFWDASTRTFTDAIDLHVGDHVLSDRGRTLTIKVEHIYYRTLTAYNLQIGGIHTYYAGTTPVLVHNSCGPESVFEVKTRTNPGQDGGISRHLIEKVDGQTVSVTHQVEVDGEIVHQHQRYVGVSGEQRYFPSEWSQFPDINYLGGW